MSVLHAIGESPLSLVLVLLAIGVAVAREIYQASPDEEGRALARRLSLPLLVLLVVFVVVIAARISLILDD